jgi:hypothetical protein
VNVNRKSVKFANPRKIRENECQDQEMIELSDLIGADFAAPRSVSPAIGPPQLAVEAWIRYIRPQRLF